MNSMVYSKKELYSLGNYKEYDKTAKEAAFLLGGIGTGNISIGTRGNLRDWEIFNKPGKGNILSYTFFAIRVQEKGKKPITKVLESELEPPFSKYQGFLSDELAGLPRFKKSSLKGEYPFVQVDLKDDTMPVSVRMESFNPLIPLNIKDSAIPCAYIKYTIMNTSNKSIDTSIVGTLCNPVGFNGLNKWGIPRNL